MPKAKPSPETPVAIDEFVDDMVAAAGDPEHHYHELAQILILAYGQASSGKGRERHATDLPFRDQPMQAISNLLQTNGGMAFQVAKKVHEAERLPIVGAQRELLGAIVYTAGIYLRRSNQEISK